MCVDVPILPTGEPASFTDESSQTIGLGSIPSGQRASITDRLGQTIW